MAQTSRNHAVYAMIQKDLRNQIFSGKLHPGDLLPSESQLCETYGASRETVRKGLKELETEGLIYSRPKIGYFVSSPNHNDFSVTFTEEIENSSTQYCDIHGILPDKHLQEILGVEETQKIIEFSQITRDAENNPIAFDVKYVPYERAYPSVESEIRFAVFPELTLSKVSSFGYYTNIEVSAISATDKVAAILNCNVGAPLLLIERTYVTQEGRCIGYALHYAGGKYGKLYGTSGHMR